MKKPIVLAVFFFAISATHCQPVINWTQHDTIQILSGEKWFGAAVNEGNNMPFKQGYCLNLFGDGKGNQASPLLVSSKGRYIWSESPFSFCFEKNTLIISGIYDSLFVDNAGSTLAESYKLASKRFFPASGKMPDSLLFSSPQYNTWIELKYNQNQHDILRYAHDIVNNGFPPGILMIDDNWFPYYGNFEFRKDRFEDPALVINEIHQLGFKVMLWVSPFISPDTEVFRELKEKKYLLLSKPTNSNHIEPGILKPTIIEWWNGYSAVLDFTNPGAIKWYGQQLAAIKENYGVDGYKFDAGDPEFYTDEKIIFHRKVTPNELTELWGIFGMSYPFNEYRSMWKNGNQPLAQRLRDKDHSWADLQKIIPDITIGGLLGYGFSCPDMIGGGEISSFDDTRQIDHKLIVRSAQCHALMPMMQFSVAPWRVLDSLELAAIKKAINTRQGFMHYIKTLAFLNATTGEPIVRNMEYEFPNEGFSECKDQFMLGDSIMVTPVLDDTNSRLVLFPKGKWKGDDATLITGPTKKRIQVSLDRLPWFRLIKRIN
ncbi:MAG: glycoside hydrolase family 31 protein [Ferruginibacter sp.]